MSKRSDQVPADPALPKPGDPDFDYQAAFDDLQETLRLLLDRLEETREHNDALLQTAVGYTAAPLRAFCDKVIVQRNTYRNKAQQAERAHEGLQASLRARGLPVPDDATTLSGELVQARQKFLGMAQRNARKTRAIEEALAMLAESEIDRAALTSRLEGALSNQDRAGSSSVVAGPAAG